MLKEIAIADAYAQAFEFIKNLKEKGLKNQIKDGKLDFQQNPKYPDSKPGYFTDDTIKTIAAYSCISENRPEDLTPEIHFGIINECFWKY